MIETVNFPFHLHVSLVAAPLLAANGPPPYTEDQREKATDEAILLLVCINRKPIAVPAHE